MKVKESIIGKLIKMKVDYCMSAPNNTITISSGSIGIVLGLHEKRKRKEVFSDYVVYGSPTYSIMFKSGVIAHFDKLKFDIIE